MKRFAKILVCMVTAMALAVLPSCSAGKKINRDWRPNSMNTAVTSHTLYVEKVENMPSDFILGMDASCVPSLEESGVRYDDSNGEEKDVYEILAANGIN